jgi:hypothetical protein
MSEDSALAKKSSSRGALLEEFGRQHAIEWRSRNEELRRF